MKPRTANPPMPIEPPPAVEGEMAPLLAEPFAGAWAEPAVAGAAALRARLQARVAATREAEAGMHTTRHRNAPRETVAPGVIVRWLYRAPGTGTARPGEPLRARLVDLAAGAVLDPLALGADMQALHREWLVVSGSARVGTDRLGQRDYHVVPAGVAGAAWRSDEGAVLFLRESRRPALSGDHVVTVRDADAGWPPFAPGVRRRVLWQRDGEAALLYHAEPGARVPQHTHGHDEECLMVQGELFLDDLLLQPGDYQLAPAGSGHRVTETDTGVVLYAHGDLDLRFVG